jgi:hypothetical protein
MDNIAELPPWVLVLTALATLVASTYTMGFFSRNKMPVEGKVSKQSSPRAS